MRSRPPGGPGRGPHRWTAALLAGLAVPLCQAGDWTRLGEDRLHDPEGAAVTVLQQPGDALIRLPADGAGNQVDWVRALQDGYIQPRSTLRGSKPVEIRETNVLMNKDGSLPLVLFPHKPHTQWLDCENCHEKIFRSEAGATPVSMGKILEGEYCGVCHGAVAFPLTQCHRCHSVPWGTQLPPVSGP
jgi:c(7)-type cytochrome triheme protein